MKKLFILLVAVCFLASPLFVGVNTSYANHEGGNLLGSILELFTGGSSTNNSGSGDYHRRHDALYHNQSYDYRSYRYNQRHYSYRYKRDYTFVNPLHRLGFTSNPRPSQYRGYVNQDNRQLRLYERPPIVIHNYYNERTSLRDKGSYYSPQVENSNFSNKRKSSSWYKGKGCWQLHRQNDSDCRLIVSKRFGRNTPVVNNYNRRVPSRKILPKSKIIGDQPGIINNSEFFLDISTITRNGDEPKFVADSLAPGKDVATEPRNWILVEYFNSKGSLVRETGWVRVLSNEVITVNDEGISW